MGVRETRLLISSSQDRPVLGWLVDQYLQAAGKESRLVTVGLLSSRPCGHRSWMTPQWLASALEMRSVRTAERFLTQVCAALPSEGLELLRQLFREQRAPHTDFPLSITVSVLGGQSGF
ncbi:hypothetical protein EOD39_9991 [Acipenser ruthenus]|uniref:Uncharacterized protein n=1 Tax=Acipenser ruthenus TaxID=7906 RepID=A0A444TZ40_ACIRT|nr:hypothetical protein EOD39_9991 [Acipenser ruthenus]